MIQRTSFLGIPLRTQRNRRALVLAYYGVLFGLASIPLALGKVMPPIFLMQTLTLGGLLGGISAFGGPVKNYAGRPGIEGPEPSTLQDLNLSGRPRFSALKPLDEREKNERDYAHFRAFYILCAVLTLFTLAVYFEAEARPAFLVHNLPTLLWLLLVFAFSLPQSVILWTEPEPVAEATLTLIDQPH